MRKKQPKGKSQQAIFRGTGMITTANMHSQLQQFMQGDQFYQVQLAQVAHVLTQDDIDDERYPIHEYGAIEVRLLFTEMEKQLQDLIIMLPRDPYDVNIPVNGQIVFCSKHPSFEVDVSEGMVFDQYYYFGILNILNLQNNNSIQDVSHISKDEIAAEPDDQRLGQSNFFINQSIQREHYESGDIIKSGRFGHALKFTNIRGEDQKDMLPMTTLSNHQEEQQSQDEQDWVLNYKSKITLLYTEKQKKGLIQISANRTLLDEEEQFSIIGDNILMDTGGMIINAHDKNIQIYGNQNVGVSANDNILLQTDIMKIKAQSKIITSIEENQIVMDTQNISINTPNKVTIVVGDNEIVIDASGVFINAANKITATIGNSEIIIDEAGATVNAASINLNGVTKIRGITAGETAGFCSMPVCAFTGAPHTINVVGS